MMGAVCACRGERRGAGTGKGVDSVKGGDGGGAEVRGRDWCGVVHAAYELRSRSASARYGAL